MKQRLLSIDPGLRERIAALTTRLHASVPGERAWAGATWALLLTTALILAARAAYRSGAASVFAVLIGVPMGLLNAFLGGGLLFLLNRLFGALPRVYRAVFGGAFVLLFWQVFGGTLTERLIPTAYVIVATSLVGGGVGALSGARSAVPGARRLGFRKVSAVVMGIAGVLFGLSWMMADGEDASPMINAAAATARDVPALDLPDPGAPGPHRVLRLFYGSGHDLRRPEYGAGVQLRTEPFDGSPFLHGWTGFEGWARTRYWGFDDRAMPINGRVWYPEGEGPFPLVLIVHGNHRMQDFSDPGYAYLGENLASHGYLTVSVDENFLNGAPWYNFGFPGAEQLTGDNAARGVLLLEHLRRFRSWNEEAGNPFHHKVDLERIALMGHSRGGEAIAVAASFNRLTHYPEDASVRFDYGFNIRSLVALSTTDRQITPAGVGIELKDVNYLALQGSNDGEVPYFMGMQQFERVKLTGAEPRFRAAVFIHRANHGQFNTVWGASDRSGLPKSMFFNRRPLLPATDQRRIASVFVTAFLEATLRDRKEYVPLFQDYRVGARWLPDTIYLNRYRDSTFKLVAMYDEDIDLLTTTLPGGRIAGENLTIWREQPPGRQALWGALDTRSVYLGWDRGARSGVPSYDLTLPPEGLPVSADSVLFFALADANESPSPRRRGAPRRAGVPRAAIDLTVELVDDAGTIARLPLSAVSLLQPQLEARMWKGWFSERQTPGIVFRTFLFPLSKFLAAAPTLDPRRVRTVRLVFDRTQAGVVVLDNLGFRP